MKRVAICAVAQHEIKANIWDKRFQDMLLDILEDLQGETGFAFGGENGVKNIVTCSDDFFDARTISDNAVNDVVGAANYRGEQKMAQEGLNGIGYAMSVILSGHDDVIYLAGHCKESLSASRNQIANRFIVVAWGLTTLIPQDSKPEHTWRKLRSLRSSLLRWL